MPLALRQRRPQAIIQKEGRREEVQPPRARRKLRVHCNRTSKRRAEQEHRAAIPNSTPFHRAPRVCATRSEPFCYGFALLSIFQR